MDESALDGNVLAGQLQQHLGRDMTSARGRCGHCASTLAVADLVVYARAPSSVGRCRQCGNVLLVVTEVGESIRVHWNRFALARGA
jgi:phage FluMu protein Com